MTLYQLEQARNPTVISLNQANQNNTLQVNRTVQENNAVLIQYILRLLFVLLNEQLITQVQYDEYVVRVEGIKADRAALLVLYNDL